LFAKVAGVADLLKQGVGEDDWTLLAYGVNLQP
jgi:hypothetical protein